MEKLLNELLQLALDWKNFSHKKYGWDTQRYGNVKCYFADSGDHTAVNIEEFSIGFFQRPKIEARIDTLNETHLRNLIDKYRAELSVEKSKFEKEEEREKEERKKLRIENLKKQLQEELGQEINIQA